LGCSAAGFPAYAGDPDMLRVHKLMGITQVQNDYFITQVGLAGSFFGMSDHIVMAVTNMLDSTFNTRCPPLLTESDAVPSFLVGTNPSICQAPSCPLAINSTCDTEVIVAVDTICAKYTKAVYVNNTAANELEFITGVVKLAIFGNATLNVPGILAAEGGLVGFFSGEAGNTTNRGDTAVSVNFLDVTSNQATLITHLRQFFGSLWGCSAAGFPAYAGDPDMLRVHMFMGITQMQNDYFITQVGLAASAFGVSDDDVRAVTNMLDSTFNTRCPPLLTESDAVPLILVGTNPSICQAPSCPLAVNSTCGTGVIVAVDTTCAKYTKALYVNDTADNELSFITGLVFLAAFGT
jgi:hypothetical protein